ncbi:hypothetical protein K438DRAFT_275123 [Mycena galopus ATCC 62051]|nr:hypothetical protein K438DRAFT_275123 [Mycena galopus ATCC 62051]
MSIAPLSVREAVLKQAGRARQTPDIERFTGESQIASLESQISSLDDRESLICPIRTLPVEMLATIFEFATTSGTRFEYRRSVQIGGRSSTAPRNCGRGPLERLRKAACGFFCAQTHRMWLFFSLLWWSKEAI